MSQIDEIGILLKQELEKSSKKGGTQAPAAVEVSPPPPAPPTSNQCFTRWFKELVKTLPDTLEGSGEPVAMLDALIDTYPECEAQNG